MKKSIKVKVFREHIPKLKAKPLSAKKKLLNFLLEPEDLNNRFTNHNYVRRTKRCQK